MQLVEHFRQLFQRGLETRVVRPPERPSLNEQGRDDRLRLDRRARQVGSSDRSRRPSFRATACRDERDDDAVGSTSVEPSRGAPGDVGSVGSSGAWGSATVGSDEPEPPPSRHRWAPRPASPHRMARCKSAGSLCVDRKASRPAVWSSVSSANRVGSGQTKSRKFDPCHQLHGEEPLVPFREQLVEPHQSGMGQVHQRPEFVLESVDCRRIQPEDGLERDQLVALAVERLVDHAHAARANRRRIANRSVPVKLSSGFVVNGRSCSLLR